MPERLTEHTDLGGYVLGDLTAPERARFEAHLAGCPECQAAVAELAGVADSMARMAPAFEVPAGLEGRSFAALDRAIAQDGGAAAAASANGSGGRAHVVGAAAQAPHAEPAAHADSAHPAAPADPAPPAAAPARAPRPRGAWRELPWLRRGALAGATALALAAAVLIGVQIGSDDDPALPPAELQASFRPPGGGPVEGTARVIKTGIGREISFRSDALPILPTGEYYEIWFVGPGDSPAKPNRISAGTFHPDDQGVSNVEFSAAVDPKKYPEIAITSERGDGNPAPGTEVLRATA